jgi:hypothetical protein
MADTVDTTAETQSTDSTTAGKTFSQAEVDQIVTNRLQREKEKAETQAAKAKADAEAEAAKKNGQFEQLATQRERELAEERSKREALEAEKTGLQSLQETAQALLDEQIKDFPEYVKDLLKGRPLKEQLEWVKKNAAQITHTETVTTPGNGPLPETVQHKTLTDKDRQDAIRRNSGGKF